MARGVHDVGAVTGAKSSVHSLIACPVTVPTTETDVEPAEWRFDKVEPEAGDEMRIVMAASPGPPT